MLDRIHEVRRDADLPQFVTLTFPDFFPTQEDAKRLLDNLFKRWKRRWPKVSAIWRMEVKDRKSGSNKGQVAPHFHLLVWGGIDMAQASKDWFEVNGESDYAHLKHGTDGQALKSWKGAVFYCAKYCAKKDDGAQTDGRIWGIHNRAAFPADREPRTILCTVREACRFRRLVRHYVRASTGRRKCGPLTLYTSNPERWIAAALDSRDPKPSRRE
jgi:hypothetical protein